MPAYELGMRSASPSAWAVCKGQGEYRGFVGLHDTWWMVIHYVSNGPWIYTSMQMHWQVITLQSCFGERLPFPHIRSFVTKDSSQQLTTRVLWDRINELDPASQPLVRSLVISDMLGSNKLISPHTLQWTKSPYLRNGCFDLGHPRATS